MENRAFLLAIGIGSTLMLMGSRFEGPASRAPGLKTTVVETRFAGVVREVTAYNVGVREQTSETPCIGAGGDDLCELVERGVNVCAANFAPLGAILDIEDHGECVVLDRTHRRYGHRVDIAMKENEIEEALEFGVRRRVVVVKD